MIWAALVALGVPLWLCRNRSLRKRPGDVPCKFRLTDKKRWTSAHGVWGSDVFAWREARRRGKASSPGPPGIATRPAEEEGRKKLRRLGDLPLIASLALAEGGTVEVAARGEHRAGLLGPFAESPADVGARVAQ